MTSLVSPVLSEELLLRSTRLLSNLAVSGARLGLTSHNNDLSLQHRLFGLERGAVIQVRTSLYYSIHATADLRGRASM